MPEAKLAPPSDVLVSLIGDTYREAALRNMNMRSVVEPLESIRMRLESTKNQFRLWDAIDDQIGVMCGEELQPLLEGLRDGYVRHVCAWSIQECREAFGQNAEEGWRKWLCLYAEALDEGRTLVCGPLLSADFPFPQSAAATVAQIRTWTKYIVRDEWHEGYPLWMYLAEQTLLPDTQRAAFLARAAGVQLSNMTRPDQARKLLEQAQKLAHDGPVVLLSWGDFWLNQEDLKQARECYESAIEMTAPDSAEALCNLGNLYVLLNQYADAEEQYRQAIKSESGNLGGYMSLMNLYGEPELFEEHKDSIPWQMRRCIAVEPPAEYGIYLQVGDIYLRNGLYAQAHEWYQRAIQLDAANPEAYIREGNAYNVADNYDAACRAYRSAMDAAPELFDAYRSMAALQEQREDWAEAIAWYERSLHHTQPHWKGLIECKLGEVHLRAGHPDKAEEILLPMLSGDPDNEMATNVLEQIVISYCTNADSVEPALRILQQIRDIKGEAYEASYQNLLGYADYSRAEYQAALEHFLNAVELNPARPEIRQNLVEVYRQLQEWEKAKAANETLLGMDQDQDSYHARLANILNDEGLSNFQNAEFLKAIQCLTQAIELDPNNALYHHNLGGVYRARRDWDKAKSEVEAAFSLDKDEGLKRTEMAILQESQGQLDQAMELYERAAEINPQGATDLRLHIADLYTAQKRYGDAADTLLKIIAQEPDHQDARFSLGLVYEQQNELDKALGTFQQVLKSTPKYSNAYLAIARIYAKQGSPTGLEELVKQIRAVPIESSERYYVELLIAATLEAGGDAKNAEAAYRRAVKQDPSQMQGYQSLADLLSRQQRLDDVIQVLNQMAQQPDLAVTAYLSLGNLLSAQAKYDDAEQAYRRAISQDPGEANGYFLLGKLYEGCERWEKAIEAYCDAAKLSDDVASSVYLNIASIYRRTNRLESMRTACRDVIALANKVSSPSFVLWRQMGLAYFMQDQYAEADSALCHAIEANPTDAVARSYEALNLLCQNRAAEAQDQLAEALGLVQSGDQLVYPIEEAQVLAARSPEVAGAKQALQQLMEAQSKFSEAAEPD